MSWKDTVACFKAFAGNSQALGQSYFEKYGNIDLLPK